MTYEELFHLKFRERRPTHELEKRFPKDKKKISRIALLELPTRELKSLVHREEELDRLLLLKNSLFKKMMLKPAIEP